MIRLTRQLPETVWILLVYFICMVNGLAMLSASPTNRTLLCSEKGCMAVQGATLITLGFALVVWNCCTLVKKHWRMWRYRKNVPWQRRYRFSVVECP